jgi:hypothetical protein
MNDKEYFGTVALSKSQVKQYRKDNPQSFWVNSVLNPKSEDDGVTTDAMAFGKLLHCLLLEKDKLKVEFEVNDTLGKMRTNKKWILAQADNDKTIITTAELEKATKMIGAVYEYDLYRELWSDGLQEKAFMWYDRAWGIDCKCKMDMIKNTSEGIYGVEYKTSGKIDTELYNIDKGNFQLDVGFYDRAATEKYGKPFEKFIFFFQSTKKGEEGLFKVLSVEGPQLDACRVYTDLLVREIVGRHKRWKKKDKTAWLATPEIVKWENFSRVFDEKLSAMGDEE